MIFQCVSKEHALGNVLKSMWLPYMKSRYRERCQITEAGLENRSAVLCTTGSVVWATSVVMPSMRRMGRTLQSRNGRTRFCSQTPPHCGSSDDVPETEMPAAAVRRPKAAAAVEAAAAAAAATKTVLPPLPPPTSHDKLRMLASTYVLNSPV